MPGPIHLYVSSSSDLLAEREALGQVVAALPLTLGWQISHTPLSGAPQEALGAAELESAQLGAAELGARVLGCDLYVVILGQDFCAPMGFEVRTILASNRRPLGAYLKACSRSPSAQDALRTLEFAWQPFSTVAAFSARFRRDLLRALLEVGPSLGLDLGDIERLIEANKAADPDVERPEAQREGAGRSGRILGREVWEAAEQG